MNKRAYGFTIVELLIVIVVIAILASISIVTYTGIQQRSKNAAIVNAASQSLKSIQAYIAMNGSYPLTAPDGQIQTCTINDGCRSSGNIGVSSVYSTAMSEVGSLPTTVPAVDSNFKGIIYRYNTLRTVNGQSQPAILIYWLQGSGQSCGLPGVLAGVGDATVFATNPYSASNSTRTTCYITIPGPAHG